MSSLHKLRAAFTEAFRPASSDSVGFALLVALVLTAPLLYGGIVPGGNLLIELLAFGSAAAAALSKAPARPLGAAALPAAAVLGLALLGLVQLLPLPESLLSAVSPVSLAVWRETAELLRLFESPLRVTPRISIAPEETAGTILLVLAYVAAFLAAYRLLGTRSRRRVFLGALFAAGLFQVAYAVLSASPSERMHGSFVNPDHLAGYLEISVALAFGAVWVVLSYGKERARHLADRGARLETRLLPLAPAILLFGTLATGIGLTQSRGGMLACAATALFLLVALSLKARLGRRRAAAAAGTLALLSGLAIAVLSLDRTPLLRFLALDPRDIGRDTRVQLWQLCVEAWREFPIAGSGLGTFREAFRRVQPREFTGLVEWAHSDALQLLVTAGAAGAVLGAVALASGLFLLLRAFLRQKHREESTLCLAGLGALFSLTLHGLVDFSFSLPAVPVTLAAVLGGAWAAGLFTSSEANTGSTGPPARA